MITAAKEKKGKRYGRSFGADIAAAWIEDGPYSSRPRTYGSGDHGYFLAEGWVSVCR
jgi:hypothetical protein